MRRLFFVLLGVASLVAVALPASADACFGSDIVVLWQNSDFAGGCVSYNGDANISGTFNNGASANDGTSSLWVAPGYRVRLFEHGNWSGASKEFVGDVFWIGSAWNDRASSLWVDPDSCPSEALVRVYVNSNFGGGCKTFNESDSDFNGNSFDDGTHLNDNISSIVVKPGYQAVLHSANNYGGDSKLYVGNNTGVGTLNDVASSITVQVAPPDGQPPSVTRSTNRSPLIAGIDRIQGSASDNSSGVARVVSVFRPMTLASADIFVEADLSCSDSVGLSCTWSAAVPLTLLPGQYLVYTQVFDKAGFSGTETGYSPIIV